MSSVISVMLRPFVYFESRLKSVTGKRFKRFAIAALVAVTASQVTLTICLGAFRTPAEIAGFVAWVTGAASSYLMSRWAWERKGRPRLLKETLPFWLIAACVAIVLTSTAKLAGDFAGALGLSHSQHVLFVDVAFFAANCVTFLIRFFIFHYLLFVEKKS